MKMNNNLKPGWLFFLPWSLEAVGGVNRVVTELARAMQQKGDYIPYILISSWEDVSPRVIEREHYTEIHLRIRKPTAENNTVKAIVSFLLHLPDSLWSLHKLFKQYNIRVVNPHYLTSVSSLFLIYRRLFLSKTFLFISLHGTDVTSYSKLGSVERLLYRLILLGTDKIITCSNGLKEKVMDLFPNTGKKNQAIPNGYSSDICGLDRKKTLEIVLPAAPYILSVGTFIRLKGFDVLLEAYSSLSKNAPFDLVLVGRADSQLVEIRQKIEALNLSERVHVYTDISPNAMVFFYSKATLFVLASRAESFGLVLLEAAVNKVPLISTKTMGGCEIIDDGVDGYLVNIDDAEALAKAMMELLSQPEKMQAYAEAAFKKVSQKYTWEKACHAYCELAKD